MAGYDDELENYDDETIQRLAAEANADELEQLQAAESAATQPPPDEPGAGPADEPDSTEQAAQPVQAAKPAKPEVLTLDQLQARVQELEKARAGLVGDLQQERIKRRAADDAQAEARRRAEQIFQRWQETKKQAPAEPDDESDPVDRLLKSQEETRQAVEKLNREREQERESASHRQFLERTVATYEQRERAFREQHPDFDQAFAHVEAQYLDEVRRRVPAEDVERAMLLLKLKSVSDFEQAGQSLPEFIYNRAIASGWSPGSAPAAPPPAAAAPATRAKPAPKSLSSMAGSGARSVAPMDLMDMDPDQFNAIANDPAKLAAFLAQHDGA